MVGMSQLRKSKIKKEFKIVVGNQELQETSSEKLLGVIVNNVLTWKNHLYGDEENEGLIQQLSKRVGMLKMMSKYVRKDNLSFFANGMFYSKLIYCLPLLQCHMNEAIQGRELALPKLNNKRQPKVASSSEQVELTAVEC